MHLNALTRLAGVAVALWVASNVAATTPRAASQAPASTLSLPSRGDTIEAFVPPHWSVENQLRGDLNGDHQPDLALVLVEAESLVPSGDTERKRAIVLLLNAEGGWRRVGFSTSVLQCPTCGGALYGGATAPAHVSLVGGSVIVRQDHGSRNVVEQTFRFRYESATDRFWLIGLDTSDRDRATGRLVKESTNFLTGQKVATESQFDGRTQQFVVRSSTRQRVDRARLALEEVNYEAF